MLGYKETLVISNNLGSKIIPVALVIMLLVVVLMAVINIKSKRNKITRLSNVNKK